jgi:allantoinase
MAQTERVAWVGATVVDVLGARRGAIVTSAGSIGAFVEEGNQLPPVDRVEAVDDDAFLLPAAIDVHCHFRVGDTPAREGFHTGTKAALAGGIGTILEHPQASPTVVDTKTLRAKATEASEESVLDFGLWVGAVPGNASEVGEALADGACGVKAFMCEGNPQFPPVSPEELAEAMRIAVTHDAVFAVHAEWQPTLDELRMDVPTYKEWMQSRPIRAEVEAVEVACRLAAETRVRLHLVHLSCSAAVRRGLAWRRKGVDVTLETGPHYLFLDSRDAQALGPFAKCMPPLRAPKERHSLLDRLESDIDIVGSDHAPHRLEDRASGLRKFDAAPSGLATNQFMVPCVATALCRRLGSPNGLRRLSEVLTSTPAIRFRLTDRQSLRVGQRADFMILHARTDRISSKALYNQIPYTPLDGAIVDFQIGAVVLNGEVACSLEDGIRIDRRGTWLRWPRGGL